MKQRKFNKIFLIALIFCALTSAVCVYAQTQPTQGYMTREPIPGQGVTNDFITYLSGLYSFGIGAAAILAIVMIGVGAFTYIVTSAGNSSKMGDSKDMIFNAIYGLIIALVAYLILFVVNPDLVGGTIKPVPQLKEYIGTETPTSTFPADAQAACNNRDEGNTCHYELVNPSTNVCVYYVGKCDASGNCVPSVSSNNCPSQNNQQPPPSGSPPPGTS